MPSHPLPAPLSFPQAVILGLVKEGPEALVLAEEILEQVEARWEELARGRRVRLDHATVARGSFITASVGILTYFQLPLLHWAFTPSFMALSAIALVGAERAEAKIQAQRRVAREIYLQWVAQQSGERLEFLLKQPALATAAPLSFQWMSEAAEAQKALSAPAPSLEQARAELKALAAQHERNEYQAQQEQPYV